MSCRDGRGPGVQCPAGQDNEGVLLFCGWLRAISGSVPGILAGSKNKDFRELPPGASVGGTSSSKSGERKALVCVAQLKRPPHKKMISNSTSKAGRAKASRP